MTLFNFANYSLGVNLILFTMAAGVVWFAGTRLAVYADGIADQTSLGRAFVGLLLLAGATSLPELATTITASAIGNAPLAVNNLLGGVAMQTAVLAVVDLAMVKGALTFFSAKPVLLLEGVLLVALLGLTLAGIAAGEFVSLFQVGLWSVLLFGAYLLSLNLLRRYESREPWRPVDLPDELVMEVTQQEYQKRYQLPVSKLYFYFATNSLIVFLAGWIVAQVGDTLATQTGLGGSFVGATLIAITTSLPEVSTTVSTVRLGAYDLAVANIFGSNALMVALFFVADIFYSQGLILEAVDSPAIFMAALGIVVTCVYLWGLLERRNRTVLRMGVDSAVVLILYLGGLVVLYQLR